MLSPLYHLLGVKELRLWLLSIAYHHSVCNGKETTRTSCLLVVIVLLLVLILVVEILELVVMVLVGEVLVAVIVLKVSVIRLHTRESGINKY
jgi:low temperature requirement protein LtrA